MADCQWWQIVNGGNALVPDCYADVVAGYHHKGHRSDYKCSDK